MRLMIPLCTLALLSACSQNNTADDPIRVVSFNEQEFRQDIQTLASDEFEGRAPTTRGEQLTLDYLSQAFADMGLEPGSNGSYLQKVPMVSYTASETQAIQLAGIDFQYPKIWCSAVAMMSNASTSPTRRWCLSVTVSTPPSTTGTTTRAWT